MCGSCTWSDHRLVKYKLNIHAKFTRHTSRLKLVQKLNTDRLKSFDTRERLATKLHDAYATLGRPGTTAVEN